MIYYKSKQLSDNLRLNLAKWKRWSREFLPPDVLGGLQSGIARQFNLKEAFKVFLGGFLVGSLKFSIPEAKQILHDLSPWLKTEGFFNINPTHTIHPKNGGSSHYIYIHCLSRRHFAYVVRTVIHLAPGQTQDHWQEHFTRCLIQTEADPIQSGAAVSAQIIAISALYRYFRDCID